MTFCILDTACVVYDRSTQMAGLAYGGALCQGCRDQCRSDLNLLRYDYIDLSQMLVPAGSPGELGKIWRPKPASKPPINMAAYHLREQIAWFVAVIADEVRIVCGSNYRASIPVREGYALDHNVRYLMERADDVAELPPTPLWVRTDQRQQRTMDGPAVVLGLRTLHHQARTMCGTEARTITVPGWCQECQTPSLRRKGDSPEKIWCLHCGRAFTPEEYHRMVRLQVPVDRPPP